MGFNLGLSKKFIFIINKIKQIPPTKIVFFCSSAMLSIALTIFFSYSYKNGVHVNNGWYLNFVQYFFRLNVIFVLNLFFFYDKLTEGGLIKLILGSFFIAILLKLSILYFISICCCPSLIPHMTDANKSSEKKIPKWNPNNETYFSETLEHADGKTMISKIDDIMKWYCYGKGIEYRSIFLDLSVENVRRAKGMEDFSLSTVAFLKAENFQGSIQSSQIVATDLFGHKHSGWDPMRLGTHNMPKIGGMIEEKDLVIRFLEKKSRAYKND